MTTSNIKILSVNLLLIGMLPSICFATEPLVSKSVSIIQGEESVRYFYYDELDRLVLLEEYDSTGKLTQQKKHTYYGLKNIDSTYIKGKFAYSMVTTYRDSTYQYISTQCLLNGNGNVRNSSEYTYDQHHRLTRLVESENNKVVVITTYTYSPFRCTCIVNYAHHNDDVFKTTYYDRLCTHQKLERCITSEDKLVRKTRYDSKGRVTEYVEMKNGKITQQISHLYFKNQEVIINLDGDIFINYYK